MISWKEDCTLFKFEGGDFLDKIADHHTSTFEKISYKKINESTLEIAYSWIDPVRMKDKLIAREQRDVNFWVFIDVGVLCCFSNSESSITYAISKLSHIYDLELNKINTYQYWKDIFLNKHKILFAELIGIHIKKYSTAADHRDISKISVNSISLSEIEGFIRSDLLTSLTFQFKLQTFYLDATSVLSFPDTSKEKMIFEVIEKIVKDI
ncbi:hypothetical protein [Paenibacillus ginsengarvi]|uniref:Uncharacterized protein n=1 Tax=Paenibacillus ginsengarvi TaxID=400777 RepID=A0A3B0BRL9_9BACL|nr:hypothetical protein [Paenibacillus ginsengarvi]RKN74988.1 hypothetical protein D7M11_25965 [Paenibacillus ginsengarvi]